VSRRDDRDRHSPDLVALVIVAAVLGTFAGLVLLFAELVLELLSR
jgi:uncharacterized protein involved in exopolysaccharide biosynthesis